MRAHTFALSAVTVLAACAAVPGHDADDDRTRLPNAQFITPLAAPGSTFQALNPGLKDFPDYTVGQAMSEVLSPDGKTLLIVTSGYNRLNGSDGKQLEADSNEYVFVYDVSGAAPRQTQILQVPNTFAGLAFAPDGKRFYVSGGGDDEIHAFDQQDSAWVEHAPPMKLGHQEGDVPQTPPVVAGIAISADGKHLVAANYYNDSLSLLDVATGQVLSELDLRPGKSGGAAGTPGGENPFWVSIKGDSTVYVGSQRDREVDVVDIVGGKLRLSARIPLEGTP